MQLFHFLLSAALAVSLPDGAKHFTAPSGRRFLLLGSVNRSGAPQQCADLGARLANLQDDQDFDYLAKQVKGSAWVDTFNKNTFGGACIAFFEGGAIAVPFGSCESKQAVLCEVQPNMHYE